jgi:hypothetical protein
MFIHRAVLFRCLSGALMMLSASTAQAGAPVFSLGLDIVQIHSVGGYVDMGYAVKIGYGLARSDSWTHGVQMELMKGWSDNDSPLNPSDLRYQSNALFFTAQPLSWPVRLKLGVVNAHYRVVLDELGSVMRSEDETGLGLGMSLDFEGEGFRVELFDFKHMRIGDDRFNSVFVSVLVAFF